MTVNIGSIMSKNVVTVAPDDNLYKIREIFHAAKFHHLIVSGVNQLLGVISDRDLLKQLSPSIGTSKESLEDRKCLEKKAKDIMNREPVAVTRDIDVKSAARLMLSKRVSCLPVATKEGRVEGIVTLRGILKYYIENDKPGPRVFGN